jgi:hypothetical protein
MRMQFIARRPWKRELKRSRARKMHEYLRKRETDLLT